MEVQVLGLGRSQTRRSRVLIVSVATNRSVKFSATGRNFPWALKFGGQRIPPYFQR